MNRQLLSVISTQFLTAFADNAVLFTAITLVMNQTDVGSWYIPALQASFLVAFVFLAPWVGRYADNKAKPSVLFNANLIKAFGGILLVFQIEPLISYAVIGLGAAMYSPAKYGILPELVDEKTLVKANGWIEGSTILAILSGTLVGAIISEYSINLSLFIIISLYLLSSLIALNIRHTYIACSEKKNPLTSFFAQTKGLLATPRARFSTLAVSLFWAAATVLRVLLVAWAPAVLFIDATTDIAMLTLFVAVGIAIGAFLVPYLIPMAYLRRSRIAAYAMGFVIIVLATIDNIWLARSALLLAGICGGLFVVPINAALQEIGHKTIGSGGAVAIQNFFENFTMLLASGAYAMIAGYGVDPVTTMIWLGLFVVVATCLVSWHLPRDTGELTDTPSTTSRS